MGVYVVTGGSGGIGGKTVEILREQGDLNMDDVLDTALQKAARWHGRVFKGEG